MVGGVTLGQDDLHARAKAILGRLHDRQTGGLAPRETVASDRPGRAQPAPADHFPPRRSHLNGIVSNPAVLRSAGFGARAAKPSFILDPGQKRTTIGADPNSGYGSESSRLHSSWTA
eukprot:COSAG06_NODE_20072_length_810_cov_0.637131_1_plen_116_part_10